MAAHATRLPPIHARNNNDKAPSTIIYSFLAKVFGVAKVFEKQVYGRHGKIKRETKFDWYMQLLQYSSALAIYGQKSEFWKTFPKSSANLIEVSVFYN